MNKIEFAELNKKQMIIAFNQLKDDYSKLFNELEEKDIRLDQTKVENRELVDLNGISANDLYDKLCTVLNFNEVIKLYKLLKFKMENLEDEPRITAYDYKETKGVEIK